VTCPCRLWLGVYLVGALVPDEYDRMRAHLEDCATCRQERAELAPVVELLGTVMSGAALPCGSVDEADEGC
jgi:hypothetical protein